MAKANPNNIQTPVVTLKYLHLTKPDDHFNPENPDYNVTFVMSREEGRDFIAEVEKRLPQFKGKVPSNRDDEDNYIFKAKQKSAIEWKDKTTGEPKRTEFKPIILNADNTPYDGAEPWGGSTGEVAILLRETKRNGKPHLALSLKGVRLHDVVLGGDGDDEDGDPLFGNNFVTAKPKDAPAMVAPEDNDAFDDDIPF